MVALRERRSSKEVAGRGRFHRLALGAFASTLMVVGLPVLPALHLVDTAAATGSYYDAVVGETPRPPLSYWRFHDAPASATIDNALPSGAGGGKNGQFLNSPAVGGENGAVGDGDKATTVPAGHIGDQRATLNRDGTWGHGDGPGTLTNKQTEWLRSHGFSV